MGRLPTTVHYVRSHEIMDYKRCPKMWFWKWRKGLVPKAISFGALELGTWMHLALAEWYKAGFKRSRSSLAQLFLDVSNKAIKRAIDAKAPQHALDKACELEMLGSEMAVAYQSHYQGNDAKIDVLATEVPLEFTFESEHTQITHKLKPDLIYFDPDTSGDIWLMEHKTAAQIRTAHLVIDGQARPYGAMAERALRNAGLITASQRLRGIMYNFLRKGLPDLRPVNEKGQSLNKNGTVSKKQPAINFLRHPVTLTREAKIITLERIQRDSLLVALTTQSIRARKIDPRDIPKTSHNSCPKICPFFEMCVAEENGADIRTMEETMYVRRDPYVYYEETTDEPASFEMG